MNVFGLKKNSKKNIWREFTTYNKLVMVIG